MRKILFLSSILILNIVSNCSYKVERDYKDLVMHIKTEPPILNPILNRDAVASDILSLIFDTLLHRDLKTLKIKPRLAYKWEISEDKLKYTFYLRDDVYWHDGVKMTADDVIFSFNMIKDPKVDAATLRVYFRDIKKVEKIDDYTVKFTYRYPYFKALEVIGGALPVIPKHIYSKDDFNKQPVNRMPVGNGPYKFDEWKTGRWVSIVRNKNYWGGKPDIEGIKFRIITDNNVAFQVLKKGQIDFAELTAIQWEKQSDSNKFKSLYDKHKYYPPTYSYIAWNQKKPFFKDPRVRKAMTMMVNRKKIKEKLYFDLVEIVTGTFYKYGPAYNHEIEPYPYDPERAVELLNEAGWIDHDGDGIRDKDGVPFKFTFMTSGSGTSERITSMLREDLKKIGVDMDANKFEWAVFTKNLNDRAFDATMLRWATPIESDPYQLWHSSQVERGSNFIGFKNKEVDKIIEAARREFNPKKRRKLFHRFHEILHQKQPYTFLFTPASLLAIQKRFENVKIYPAGTNIRKWRVTQPDMKLYQ